MLRVQQRGPSADGASRRLPVRTPSPRSPACPTSTGRSPSSQMPVALGVAGALPGLAGRHDSNGRRRRRGQRCRSTDLGLVDRLRHRSAGHHHGRPTSRPSGTRPRSRARSSSCPSTPATSPRPFTRRTRTTSGSGASPPASRTPRTGRRCSPTRTRRRLPVPARRWEASGPPPATVQNGIFDGLPWNETDSYTFDVEAAGTLELPELTFTQALAVHSQVTTTPAVGEASSVAPGLVPVPMLRRGGARHQPAERDQRRLHDRGGGSPPEPRATLRTNRRWRMPA